MIVGAWEKPAKQDKLRAAVGATQLTFDPFHHSAFMLRLSFDSLCRHFALTVPVGLTG